MEVREITDKKTWETFVLSQDKKTFLHSWNWGEFNSALSNKIWRLGIYSSVSSPQELIGVVLVIKISARRGTFLFVPQGPIGQSTDILESLTDYLKKLAEEEACDFIRISPALDNNEENQNLFKKLGFRRAPIHMHAELMWILDVRPSEEQLLKAMRKNTRYSVKKAEKEGVEIRQSFNPDDVLRFNRIYKETAERHKFTPYSLDYLQKEFDTFVNDNQISIFLARYKNEIIAGAIIVFYNGVGFYHHGATSSKYARIPASQLLQWEVIKEAKRRGCKLYNFWGIVEGSPPAGGHPWAGLSLFKKGFGGFSKEYLHAQDLPIKPRYWLNFIVEKTRKAKRHL